MTRLVNALLGYRFPASALAAAGYVLLWTRTAEGLTLLFAAGLWGLWQDAVGAYGARGGKMQWTTIKYMILVVSWAVLAYGIALVF